MFKTWFQGWDKNDKATGKCMAAHGTADYPEEHADTLTRVKISRGVRLEFKMGRNKIWIKW